MKVYNIIFLLLISCYDFYDKTIKGLTAHDVQSTQSYVGIDIRYGFTVIGRDDEIFDQRTGVLIKRWHVSFQYFKMKSVGQQLPPRMPFLICKTISTTWYYKLYSYIYFFNNVHK